MSQLYQLFCEGIKARDVNEGVGVGVGLSSTLLYTSTPLEDDDDPKPGRVSTALVLHQDKDGEGQDDAAKAAAVAAGTSPSLSVQGQVGSASPTEGSAPADEAPSPKPARASDLPQAQSQGKTRGSQTRHKRLGTRGSIACSPSQPSQHLRERNPNVSPVDFVDRAIAVTRRDKALGINKIRVKPSSDGSQNSEPAVRSRKRVSDSSETDFEGAEEYYKKNPPASTSAQAKPMEPKSPAKKVRGSVSSRKSSDESMNLVLDCVSITESSSSSSLVVVSESESVEIEDIESPSAARCRAFSKPQHRKSKSPECSPLVSSETRDDKDKQPHAKNILIPESSNLHPKAAEDIGNKSVGSTSEQTPILEGVIAYVEVRSGHDNRSMGVRTHLRNLGATVLEKFTKEVTHVVFNEGAPSTLRRAQNQQCFLVSVLWIDECEKVGRRVPEDKHPPLNMHLYDNELTSTKYRKMKSLQPDFEEGKSEERLNNYVKKFRRKAQKAISSQQTNESSSSSDESRGDSQAKNTQHRSNLVPDGVVLKRLSVILNRVDATEAPSASMIRRNNKRRLMPLCVRPPSSLSLEDFDLAERLRPVCPYNLGLTPKQKPTLTQRPPRKTTPASVSIRRRSSCFVRGTQRSTQSQYKQKRSKPQMRTMVCTFMHRRDIDVVAAVIKQLGGWILEPTVSAKTTHVVCGDSKRTINLLRGIAHGCWILHQEWVMRSLEAGHWLDEESFELSEFPAVQQCRVARETLGVCPDIFSAAGAIFVAKETTPPRADLLDLLKLCGAQTVNAARQAKVVVGQHQRRASHSKVALVNEQWVLDSIQENMLQPLRCYYL